MKLIAKSKGFYQDRLIEVGQEFEADEGFSSKWAVPVDKFETEVKKSAKQLEEEAREGLQGKKRKASTKKASTKKASKKTAKNVAKK